MDINATSLGQLVLITAIVIGLVSYYLGRRKTRTPAIAGLLGFVLGLVPLLGLIYLGVLVLKRDVVPNSTAGQG